MKKKLDGEIGKGKNYRSLRYFLAFIIFSMIVVSLVMASMVTFMLAYLGLLSVVGASPFGIVVSILAISVAVASMIAYYINNRVLKPIGALSEASQTVATGDFNVRITSKTDIEELNATFDNFNNMVSELSSIETLRNDFIANVSHEFKTPLAAIEGYAMLLQDDNLSPEERNEYIKKITDSTRQLSSLTGDILLISKLENQNFVGEKRKFRLDEQIREAILTHEIKWTNKNLDIDVELEEMVYYGEDGLLLQVWLNLIGNAIKFTPEGGKISVELAKSADRVVVKVNDTGIGMDESTSKHIFEKFYQGDTSHKSEGNGLGLALCKKIVEMCNGEISVTSIVGQGSCFTVVLPVT